MKKIRAITLMTFKPLAGYRARRWGRVDFVCHPPMGLEGKEVS